MHLDITLCVITWISLALTAPFTQPWPTARAIGKLFVRHQYVSYRPVTSLCSSFTTRDTAGSTPDLNSHRVHMDLIHCMKNWE